MLKNILVLGSGGREHAFVYAIKQSTQCGKLYAAPGNPGISQMAECVSLAIDDFAALFSFCEDNRIDLLVVGPEAPLVAGITDYFRERKSAVKVIGPSAHAAMLEGSKSFAKKFMQKHNIPTAAYFEVTSENLAEGIKFLESLNSPYVLKADGLAAGKGVLIIDDLEDAKKELKSMLSGKFGDASSTVVIEEFLDGIEFSVFVITDGKDYVILPEAKDYKRIGEGNTGLNTGGMGSVSPVPFVQNTDLMQKVENSIIKPTIEGISAEGMEYIGFVFFGLIRVGEEPYVIEYNCRMGDPETESVLPRIQSDFITLLDAAASRKLLGQKIIVDPRTAATVVVVSGGYPEQFHKGLSIQLPENDNGSLLFHSGTTSDQDQLKTSGGRVFAVTNFGSNINEAVRKSIHMADQIQFEGKYFRRDIGFDLQD
jgi:phosphoribosylamine--glycine ligase